MARTIDVHTHHYPDEVRRDPAGWAVPRGELNWSSLVTQGPQGWASAEEFLTALDEAEIDQAILLGWYWENIETCVWHNRFYAACLRAHPRRWRAFAAVQPTAGWTANRTLLEEALAAGFSGIGEVQPIAQGFSLRDEVWLKICQWAEAHDWPINLHVTEPAGHEYPGRVETPLMDYVWMAEQFPQVRFIFAHWGGGLPFFMLNRRVRKALKNCYFDSAASPLLYDTQIWTAVCGLIGPERVLFGTDFPLRLKPRHQSVPSIRLLRQELEDSGLSAEAIAKILGGNAEFLFGPPA